MSYEELQADYDRRANDKQDWYNGGYGTDIDSGISYLGTLGYINDQQQHDEEEWKPLKALWNGFYKQAGRAFVGNVQMRLDSDIACMQEEHPEVGTINSTQIAQGYLNGKDATVFNLTPYQIKADSTASQVAYGFLEGAGQLASQAIVSGLTGGWGGAIYMGTQIAGSQYADLRAQGVDADRALAAVLANAAIQAPMEKVGFSRLFKALPQGSGLRQKAMQILESAVTEGVTEGLQELPEQFTDIWAKNEGLDALGVTEEWSKDAEDHIKDMVFSGVIGGLLGGSASTLNVGARSLGNVVENKIAEKLNNAMVESFEQNAEKIKASGINPARAAAEIDARNPEGVSVDASLLKQAYGQTAGELRKVAESLGVTEEEINEAAENGLDIGVTRGKLTATMASVNGFAQTVHEHISFNDGVSSVNYAEMKKDLAAAYEAGEQAESELDAELDRITGSANEAGAAQPHAESVRALLESRAMIANPDNPVAWLKKHALDFINAGKKRPAKGLYQNGKLNKDGFYSANITGSEMGSYKDVSDLRNKAVAWYRNNLQGTTAYNPTIGEIRLGKGIQQSNIGFNSKGRGKMKVTSAKPEKLLATRYLKELIENNAFVTEADGQKEKHNGEHFYYIHGALNINGKRQYIVINVKESADNVLNYYNHNVFNENEYKKIEDALRPSFSKSSNMEQYPKQQSSEDALRPTFPADSSAGQNPEQQSSFANSVSQKGQVYKQQRIVEGKEFIKGAIEPQEDGSYVISLFEHADASTIIHETGHYFFDTFMRDSVEPDADERMKRDRKRLLEYVGLTEEQWNNADLEGRRVAHEKMAEAFETYIMEGKAPTRKLRGVFNRFSKWLKAVYEKYVRNNNSVELTDDVRDVFDHWFASEADIEQRAKVEGYFAKLPDGITKHLSDKQKQWLVDKIAGAKDEAVNLLTKEYMRNFSPERRKAIAEFRAQVTPDIEKQVAEERVNRARDAVADMFAKYPSRVVKDKEFYEVERNGRTFLVSKDRKEEVMLAANPKTIAWKYKHILGHTYYNYADRLAAVEKEIDDMLEPIVDKLKEGYGHGIEEFWIDVETGKEADVSDLGEEKRTGHQYKKLRHSLNAPWYQNWYKDKKHTPTKAELRELAYDLYTGVDKYGYYGDMNLFGSAEEAAEFKRMSAEQKAEIDELISLRDAIKANPELVEMSRKRALSDEDRVSFELIAEDMGYDSGDAMADAIINEPSARQMVRDRVEQAIKAKFPDAAKEREQAEAAQMEALYNDESGMVIAFEQQLIEDAANEALEREYNQQEREALAKVRKAETDRDATAAMRKMTIGDALKASKFAMAERRAAANAQRAMKKGNMEEAAEYKRQQAISHAMVRKSVKLKQEVERNRKFIRKLRTMKKENFGTEQHLNQIGAFLARMGLVRKDYNPNNRTQTLREYLAEMREKLGDMVVSAGDDSWPPFILDESYDLRDSNNMSIEEYGEVVKMLRQLRNIAKQDTQVELEGKAKAFAEVKQNVLENANKVKDTEKPLAIGEKRKVSLLNKISAGMMSFDNLLLKMDDWKEGYFTNIIGIPIKHCGDKYATLLEDFRTRSTEALNRWITNKAERAAALEKRHYDELGGSANKVVLVKMLANLGNEGNSRALCGARPAGTERSSLWVIAGENNTLTQEQAITQTRENLIKFLSRNLTERDIQFAQDIVDNCSRYWPEVRELNLDTKGFAPEEVVATPIALTLEGGKTVLFKGGYLPLVRDTSVDMAKGQDILHPTDSPYSNAPTMSTSQKSSKARTGATYSVDISANSEYFSMEQTFRDIAFRKTIMELNKLFKDKEVWATLRRKYGTEYVNAVVECLSKCANPYSNRGADMAEQGLGGVAAKIKDNMVSAIVAFNATINLQNFGNIALYANAAEGYTFRDALSTVPDVFSSIQHHREMNALMLANSPFMRERAAANDITLKEMLDAADSRFDKGGRIAEVHERILKGSARLMALTDNITAAPNWCNAFKKKLNEGASKQEAADFADRIMRRTLGSSRMQDVSSYQRGSKIFKLFTAFHGFFNTQYNQWLEQGHRSANLWRDKQHMQAVGNITWFLFQKWLLACVLNCIFGFENPFEEDKKGWKKITKELVTYPMSTLGWGGSIANSVVSGLLDMENYGYRMSIVENVVGKGVSIGRKASRAWNDKGDWDELVEPTLELGLIAAGLPLQPLRTTANVWDWLFNDMELELRDIARRRPKSER